MGANSGESPNTLASRVRADFRQARTALSRTRLRHGEGSPAHQRAQEHWRHRQAVLDVLAERRGDTDLTRVPALELLDAVRAVRATVAAADPGAEFLTATAFLDETAVPTAGSLPDWSPEPPSWAPGDDSAA
ncbi:hypothetical protein ACFXC8_13385 [Streptomyces sp. NPDC059441]|uniref:hypothetical protein n=1 Tax=Streptomyces sp. NPDC059441 TaxID=3346829 RepID=UPI0036D12C87